ncbi:hypothetical protein DM02DRAFT_654784 [Periconia macrospinosa]|uniref:Uncharacterized protein n=1 Tax=Periconia macrospinosa TaxID=97972 RepID=A0A2V1DSW1_9PLEO|nr:hypothetical protein DM02DRAFT_654784 [Periconia macrospinosa]
MISFIHHLPQPSLPPLIYSTVKPSNRQTVKPSNRHSTVTQPASTQLPPDFTLPSHSIHMKTSPFSAPTDGIGNLSASGVGACAPEPLYAVLPHCKHMPWFLCSACACRRVWEDVPARQSLDTRPSMLFPCGACRSHHSYGEVCSYCADGPRYSKSLEQKRSERVHCLSLTDTHPSGHTVLRASMMDADGREHGICLACQPNSRIPHPRPSAQQNGEGSSQSTQPDEKTRFVADLHLKRRN